MDLIDAGLQRCRLIVLIDELDEKACEYQNGCDTIPWMVREARRIWLAPRLAVDRYGFRPFRYCNKLQEIVILELQELLR
jgi:hypothetical protein